MELVPLQFRYSYFQVMFRSISFQLFKALVLHPPNSHCSSIKVWMMNRFLPTYSREQMYLLALMGFLGKGIYPMWSFISKLLIKAYVVFLVSSKPYYLNNVTALRLWCKCGIFFLRNQAMTPKLQNNLLYTT